MDRLDGNRLQSASIGNSGNHHFTGFNPILFRLAAGRSLALLLVFCLGLSGISMPAACGQNQFFERLFEGGETQTTADANVKVLLFTQEQCPPCQQIRPMIDFLISNGYPIEKIDVAATPQIANQWSVNATPTLVVVADDREVSRTSGIVTANDVGKMLINAGYSADLNVLNNPKSMTPLRTLKDQFRPGRRGHRGEEDLSDPRTTIPVNQWSDWEEAALKSTVRLKVCYMEGRSRVTDFGTGTVIHRHENDILILTCGHVFRDSQGQAEIQVDLGFEGQDSQTTVAGQLIRFDAGAPDVALVAATTSFPIQPVRLADVGYAPAPGTRLFSVGCDEGAPATVRRGNYLSTSLCSEVVEAGQKSTAQPVPKYDVSGRPVVGRSGGGLFAQDGTLVGVCNAAVIQQNQGVYSSIKNIHGLLDEVRLAHLFQQEEIMLAAEPGLPEPPVSSLASNDSAGRRFLPAMDFLAEAAETSSTNSTIDEAEMLRVQVPDASAPGGFRVVEIPMTEAIQQHLDRAVPNQQGTRTANADTHRLQPGSGETMRGQSRR